MATSSEVKLAADITQPSGAPISGWVTRSTTTTRLGKWFCRSVHTAAAELGQKPPSSTAARARSSSASLPPRLLPPRR